MALFLLQKRWMSSMASQKHRVHAHWKTDRTWDGHLLWIRGWPILEWKKKCSNMCVYCSIYIDIYRYIQMQMFSNALRAIICSLSRCQRKSWQVLLRLRVGTYQEHRNSSPLHMLSLFVVSHTCLTQTNVTFSQSTLEELPPRPLRLTTFITEHCELVLFHVELNLCDGFIDLHGRGQGLAAEWVDGSALRTHVKSTQTTKCCRSPHFTTWWYRCFVGPTVAFAAVPEPWGPRRRTCCSAGRLLSRSCSPERRRRGPAELARRTWPSG